MSTMESYNKLVKDELSELDIGILCLNAGKVSIGPLDLLSDKQVESTLTLNALHVVYLAKALIKQQLNR